MINYKNILVLVGLIASLPLDINGSELIDAIRKGESLEKFKPFEAPDLHAVDDEGAAPLHWAAEGDKPEVVTVLIDAGAPLWALAQGANQPLHWAAKAGRVKNARLLLEAGAEVDARNNRGQTPLHRAAEGDNPEMITLLAEKRADVNARDNGNATSLHKAVEAGKIENVRRLLKARAEVDTPDIAEQTPLLLALEGTVPQIAILLVEAGADVDALMNLLTGDQNLQSRLKKIREEVENKKKRLAVQALMKVKKDLPEDLAKLIVKQTYGE